MLAGSRDQLIQQEAVVLAEDHQNRRPDIKRVAGLVAGLRLPASREGRPEGLQLLVEFPGGGAGERDLVPVQGCGGLNAARHQPRSLGVIHVGDDDHRRRVLVEAVRHLLEAQAHVLEADFLADDLERHVGEPAMHVAHHVGDDGAVTHAGVEDLQARRRRLDVRQFLADAVAHHPLLIAGVHEHQVFLAVVVEPEGALAVFLLALLAAGLLGGGGFGGGRAFLLLARNRRGASADCRHFVPLRIGIFSDELLDLVERPNRDALAVSQSADELAVIDCPATECGFSHACLSAIGFDLPQKLRLLIHDCCVPSRRRGRGVLAVKRPPLCTHRLTSRRAGPSCGRIMRLLRCSRPHNFWACRAQGQPKFRVPT